MCEQLLIGYLLGALDADEQRVLEQRLRREPELCRELERLRACLMPLDELSIHDEPPLPPPGLAARAFTYVMARVGPREGQFAAASRWRPQDLVVAAAMVMTLAMLVFPAVSHSRYQAELRACQHNLMNLGQALVHYSQAHGGYFPEVPLDGNLAAAGVYAPTLMQAGLIEPRTLLCPAQASQWKDFRVPTLDELRQAQGVALRQMHRTMGGSYGYGLGYYDGGVYYQQRNRDRSTFALMADAPSSAVQGRAPIALGNHGVRGQNVLFEDGRVKLLDTFHVAEVGDHIFQNDLGHVGPGIGPDDAVVAASDTAPTILPLKAVSEPAALPGVR